MYRCVFSALCCTTCIRLVTATGLVATVGGNAHKSREPLPSHASSGESLTRLKRLGLDHESRESVCDNTAFGGGEVTRYTRSVTDVESAVGDGEASRQRSVHIIGP